MAKKRGGIGATGSAKARFFHPSQNIRDKWPNQHPIIRLSGVLLVGKSVHRVQRKDQLCYECRIAEIDDSTIFHIVCNNFKVEVAASIPFEDEAVVTTSVTLPTAQDGERERVAALRTAGDDVLSNIRGAAAQEVAELRQQGIEVDDDNEPAPENAQPSAPATATVGQWVTPTICPRRADPNCTNNRGSWKNKSWQKIKEMDELALFRMCFPEQWVKDVLIPATNNEIEGDALTLSQFYVYLGCHFFMACFEGISDRRLWWSSKPITIEEGAPFRLQEYISLRRFNAITSAIRYTDKSPPSFLDRFHEVRQMIESFNDHYAEGYSPSWLSCLDESMNSWLDKFCPGFMSVPRKPHPLGNEYHSIADADDGKPIMWRIKVQEGKDRPKDETGKFAFPSEFEGKNPNSNRKYTKTSTLMCEMTKPIHGTGKVVSMDSGFCVTVGILHLHDLGVFGQSLIKKRKYWPKGVPGDQIDTYFNGKPLGFVKTLRQDMGGIPFNVHCTRDDRFVTKLMSTHGLLAEVADHKTYRQKDGDWVTFNYAEYLSRHNRIKHCVDDVNNRRHDPIGLEQVWHTKWWPTRQFTFICSVVEANAVMCRARARKDTPTPQLEFRRSLAMKMMTNKICNDGMVVCSPTRARKRSRGVDSLGHELCARPNFTGCWKTETNTWSKVKSEYAKIKCSTCDTRIRTYCKCNRQVSLCTQCYGVHISMLNNTN